VVGTAQAQGVDSDIRFTSTAGQLTLGTGEAGATATLTKQGATGELQATILTSGTAADAVGDATIRSATNVRLGSVTARGGAIDVRAGADAAGAAVRDGAVTGLAVATPSGGLAPEFGRAVLTATTSNNASGAAVSGTNRSINVAAGGLVQLGAVTAGTDVTVAAGSSNIADRDGAIDISSVVANRGSIALSAFNDDATRVADVRLGTTNSGGTVASDPAAANSVAGTSATLTTSGTRGDVVVGRSLTAQDDVTLTSVRDVLLAAAPNEIRSRAGTVRVSAARTVSGLPAGGTSTGEATANGGELRAGTVTSTGTVTIKGAGNVRLREATSATGEIVLTAGGSVTGLSQNDSGDAIPGAGRLFGGGDVIVTAGSTARLSEINASRDAAVTAGVSAVGSATTGRNLSVRATASGLHVGTSSAGGTTELQTGIAGSLPSQPAAFDSSYGGAIVRAAASGAQVQITARDLAQVSSVRAGKEVKITSDTIEIRTDVVAPTVRLTNASPSATTTAIANKTLLGGTESTSTNDYVLTEAEINRISAADLNIESGAQAVEIRNLALNTGAGGKTFRVLATGQIDVTGTLSALGSPNDRTVQLGGSESPVPDPLNTNAVINEVRAELIKVTADSTGGGRLLLTGSDPSTANGAANLDLRAKRIAVGESGFLAEISGPGVDIASDFVANPSSSLYGTRGPAFQQPVLVSANQLRVSYSDYALFQNTASRTAPPTGVLVNRLDGAGKLALSSSGENANNAFALFGSINGRGGNQAALLGSDVISLTQLNRNNTRINGCVVGSGGGGCLISAASTPPLNVFDAAQTQLSATADLIVPFDPLVGTNNEALFSDLGTIEFSNDPLACDPDSDKTCPPETQQ
jgi:hypothetical protein